MQSSSIRFSPSISLRSDRRRNFATKYDFNNRSPILCINTTTCSSSFQPISTPLAQQRFFTSSLKRIGWILDCTSPPLVPGSSENVFSGVPVCAAAVDNTGEPEKNVKSKSVGETLMLVALFVSWFLFNIYFNIYNKLVLKVYHYPVTISLLQFAVGTAMVIFMWTFNLYKRPKISRSQLAAIFPMAVVHTLGNIFTNMSFGKVSVSFTHTVKAMEPFFSVIFSAMFLGQAPTLWVVSSLVPIVGGVILASMTEISFDWVGFWSAMASNATNQSRNVLSKKLMAKKEDSLDNITLFSVITIMSFLLTIPPTLIMEGVKFTPSYLTYAGLNVKQLYLWTLISCVCYHAYQQTAYMILARVSPVTHSVTNCIKRVVVIVTSVLFFRTPVSPINSLGTGIAMLGVFLYSRVNSTKRKPKTT